MRPHTCPHETALLISAGGIIVPFSTGVGLGYALPSSFLAAPDGRLVFALFMAVAMSISAVPVIAKVLFDLGLIRRDIGQITLASAMTDDTIGWILLSVVAGLATKGTVDIASVGVSIGVAVIFLVVSFTVGARVVSSLLGVVDETGGTMTTQVSVIVVVAFAAAAFTHAMGIEAVLGAFVGIVVGQARRFRKEAASKAPTSATVTSSAEPSIASCVKRRARRSCFVTASPSFALSRR